jgi:hypothetical protein
MYRDVELLVKAGCLVRGENWCLLYHDGRPY